jgi:hypothetical protein
MLQMEVSGMSEDPVEAGGGASDGARTPARRGWGVSAWGKLVLLAAAAAVLGAFAAANWREDSFSVVWAFVDVNVAVIILVSAAWGFIVGALFIWSAISRQE